MDALIREHESKAKPRVPIVPAAPPFEARDPYTFDTPTGQIVYDHALCRDCKTKICVETCVPQILRVENDAVVLNISREDAKAGKCTECLACEVECRVGGNGGGRVILPIAGLDEYRSKLQPHGLP